MENEPKIGGTAPIPVELESGKTYAWFIYCEDDMGNPIGENNGQSEIYAFTYAGKNQANIMDWRDSVKYYTSDSFLETISIKDDPCPSIQELINSLQE